MGSRMKWVAGAAMGGWRMWLAGTAMGGSRNVGGWWAKTSGRSHDEKWGCGWLEIRWAAGDTMGGWRPSIAEGHRRQRNLGVRTYSEKMEGLDGGTRVVEGGWKN